MELAVHEDIVCAIFLVCRPVSVCVCFDYLENFILNTHFELEQAFLMMMLANPVLLFFLFFLNPPLSLVHLISESPWRLIWAISRSLPHRNHFIYEFYCNFIRVEPHSTLLQSHACKLKVLYVYNEDQHFRLWRDKLTRRPFAINIIHCSAQEGFRLCIAAIFRLEFAFDIVCQRDACPFLLF